MIRRYRNSLLILTMLAVMVFAAEAEEKKYTWAGIERIVAVGDVHGDYDQFVKVLRAASVIDGKDKWIAGKTHLVQIGDVLDRGPDSRKAMDLLMSLEKQAKEAGGKVHALIGNHEAMVCMGDWRYVHPDEYEALGGNEEFGKAMNPDGKYGKWICSHNAIIRINRILFVHGGLSPEYADKSLKEMNEKVREEIKKKSMTRESIIGDPAGPLWFRGFAMSPEERTLEEIEEVLKKKKAYRMIVAHTPSTEGIRALYGGLVIVVDVGMSKHYGGPAQCLVIEQGKYYVVSPDGKKKLDVGKKALEKKSAPAKKTEAQPYIIFRNSHLRTGSTQSTVTCISRNKIRRVANDFSRGNLPMDPSSQLGCPS